MKCVINLYSEDEEIEIMTDLEEETVRKLEEFCKEERISSEDLIHILISNFFEPECLL